MKHPRNMTLLVCFSLAACGGGNSETAPAPRQLARIAAMPAAPLPTPTLHVAGGALHACRALDGSGLSACHSGQLPARFGPIIRAISLSAPATPARPSPTLRADPGADDPPPDTPPPGAPPPSGPPSGNPPAGTPPAVPKDTPLALLFEADGHADVCAYSGARFKCARIAVTMPLGVVVDAWSLPGGFTTLTYRRAPGVKGVPDPKGQAALRFQAAFDIAVKAVRSAAADVHSIPTASLRTKPGTTKNLEQEDPGGGWGNDWGGGWGGDWGGLGGGDWGGDWGGGGGGGSVGDIPVDIVSAPPPEQADVDAIPSVVVVGHVDTSDAAPPALPPRDMDEDLADLQDPCVISPIMTVCIRGERPPPDVPPDEVPAPVATPWFPQSWCDFSSILCTAGQQPAPPLTDAERRARERQECYANANSHATYCRDVQNIMGDEWFRGCMKDAIAEGKDCEVLYP